MPSNATGGLLRRAEGLLSLISRIKRVPSDEETEGLLRVMPPDTRHNVAAFFAPHVRRAGLDCLRMLAEWVSRAHRGREEGKKVILVPLNFPPELVLAFDNAVPLTSEVLTTLASVALQGGGERYWEIAMGLGLPDHICSANSVAVGSLLSGEDFLPDAMISAAPGACDANSKIHEFASHQLGIPQLLLEKPVDDSPEGIALYGRYFRTLIHQLEAFVGEELTEEKLRRVLRRANHCTELYWDLFELSKARPCPVPNLFPLLAVAIRFCMWGTDSAVTVLQTMVDEARARHQAGAYAGPEERARVLWAYTSYYFNLPGLHQWMEERGYTFLADALDLYAPRPVDLSSWDSMVDGLVAAAWDYPMNRQMGAESMSRSWARDVIFVSQQLQADCVVYCGHDACKQTWSVVSILQEELQRKAGLPLLVLHGDSWRKTTTPITVIQNEMDEFINTVVRTGRGAGGVRRKLRARRQVSPAGKP